LITGHTVPVRISNIGWIRRLSASLMGNPKELHPNKPLTHLRSESTVATFRANLLRVYTSSDFGSRWQD